MAEKEKWSERLLEELRFEEGRILVRDERFFLGHKFMLEFMHSTFEGIMGPATKAMLYHYGEDVGYYLAKGFSEKWNLEKRDLVGFMLKALTIWGFGRFSDAVYDPERRLLKAAVRGSVEVSSLSKGERPSCYFMAGLFGGLGKFLFEEEVICREKICEATGDAACEFEVEPIKVASLRKSHLWL